MRSDRYVSAVDIYREKTLSIVDIYERKRQCYYGFIKQRTKGGYRIRGFSVLLCTRATGRKLASKADGCTVRMGRVHFPC